MNDNDLQEIGMDPSSIPMTPSFRVGTQTTPYLRIRRILCTFIPIRDTADNRRQKKPQAKLNYLGACSAKRVETQAWTNFAANSAAVANRDGSGSDASGSAHSWTRKSAKPEVCSRTAEGNVALGSRRKDSVLVNSHLFCRVAFVREGGVQAAARGYLLSAACSLVHSENSIRKRTRALPRRESRLKRFCPGGIGLDSLARYLVPR